MSPYFVYTAIILILFQKPPVCFARSVFTLENDMVGIYNNHAKELSYSQLHDIIRNNSYIGISKPTSKPDNNMQEPWNMGTRVTRRQYEIINMLFRKTKIFVEQTYAPKRELSSSISERSNITTKTLNLPENKHPIAYATRPPVIVQITSTPSNFEFYYFNDLVNRQANVKGDTNNNCIYDNKCKENIAKTLNINDTDKFNSSFVIFHIKGPAIGETKEKWFKLQQTQTTLSRKHFFTTHNPYFLHGVTDKHNASGNMKNKAYTKKINITSKTAINNSVLNKVVSKRSRPPPATKSQSVFTKNVCSNIGTTESYKETTAYDKIKFFELYDRMTPSPYPKKKRLLPFDFDEEFSQQNESHEKILLQHVDQSSHGHDKAKHSKKHIKEDQNQNLDKSCSSFKEENEKPKKYVIKTKNVKKNTSTTHHLVEIEKPLRDEMVYNCSNKTVQWSEYPFAAVYIYEPSQIHCDAAGISAHWLVASGSCLSRLNKNPYGEGRSAFVTYCGENWWQPERVSYVKYSLVHPWFHPTDKARRHLYNIGVIQVVTSLKACSGWAPIDLMSHQFTTAQEGTLASAVGWGLDRFDARTSATMNLPKAPLTVYKSLLFSDSCPGNYEYSNAELFAETGYMKSLYCLSLPPYFGEDRDPVHGGLLLVDGKLIALYLQEKRRPWGGQSAQYTGIWRLIPWIMDVAREKEDIEYYIDF